MNQTIRFNADYPKLHGQTSAMLANVTVLDPDCLHPDLIEYDTKKSDGSYYQLPREPLLHLTFIGDKMIPFCTLRRWSEQKEKYYRGLKGTLLDIEVNE